MKVIEIDGGKGPASALRIAERPTPSPKAGEILIRVRAAGVNRPDIVQRNGHYPPPAGASDILGLEVAGEVEAVGEGVTQWAVGDKVCALLGGGGYAEYAVVDALHALPVPEGLSFEQAAALPETAFTVFTNVFEGGALKEGETLLIHGATSGIGVMAIQMAKAAGARVIATSRSKAKAEAAKALGADISLDASSLDLAEEIRAAGGADVVLDMVGADYAELNLKSLKERGRWVVIASLTGTKTQIDLQRIMLKKLVLTGSTLRSRPADEKARLAEQVRNRVWPWVESGQIKARIHATYPLDKAAEAHADLESGDHVGKIVLIP
ncbi:MULTISPECIES: NAD(P)H-quinone oxidoreductase [unclassified Brevundimonas]|uniref:NAD(P)H-quinone oxidoreductase n=1 Tax=unclassified Brevundimonas TaxID=2622653 RepID=UPI0025B98249|nr:MULTISPECIES: NAD(P)H-quinone oxidoreductase [unclassified Brevundimonas]